MAPEEVVPTVATIAILPSGKNQFPEQGMHERARTENERIHASTGVFFQRTLKGRATKGVVVLGRNLERTYV